MPGLNVQMIHVKYHPSGDYDLVKCVGCRTTISPVSAPDNIVPNIIIFPDSTDDGTSGGMTLGLCFTCASELFSFMERELPED